jgi:hypothetical protein
MMSDWEILSLLAGIAVFVSYRLLENGLHEKVPLQSETASIGAGLAVLAIVGVGLNSYVYSEI